MAENDSVLNYKTSPNVFSVEDIIKVLGQADNNIATNRKTYDKIAGVGTYDYKYDPSNTMENINDQINDIIAQPGPTKGNSKILHGTDSKMGLGKDPGGVGGTSWFDGRVDGEIYELAGNDKAQVSGFLWDSDASVDDIMSSPTGTYAQAQAAGYAGTTDEFKAGKLAASKEGSSDWGMDGYGGVALGAANIGLGIASYLDNKKTADAQRAILRQQYDENTYTMAEKKEYDSNRREAFGLPDVE